MPNEPERAPLHSIFRVFFMIGAISFGGGLISWVHRETVLERHWLTNEQFLPGVALAQVLPGANVTNLAVYIGQKLRGPVGAAIAVCAVLTPPFFICIGLASIYASIIAVPGFQTALNGIAAAAVGMILRMAYVGAIHGCRHIVQALMAILVFVCIGIMQWPLVPVILVLAPLSVALAWPRSRADA